VTILRVMCASLRHVFEIANLGVDASLVEQTVSLAEPY
jgi:hypothetical protein